ncbi:MAG: cyclohexa-1,5-dienecarbonyl-CoA hydratase [Antarcticimicrobium sp.]|uniref:cyclohexa-1,5-dienecarbonyl-CoA hydratase n=1 Tax=Antarcticimicrobium sp. TaxID=2824147 RepID=UPI00261B639C|nr:cyclohexa-1,5-dienecarbonyl-CoA hydratase [Antarcticimicrobium sp.]MDF1717753.1 cyclohexa-1,5-dienecarbonyl-CoA hydratase [Antarcticimicrobium sp.]
MSGPLGISTDLGGAMLRLRLNRPKANIVDAEMIAALDAAFVAHADDRDLCAVLVEAEGPHFSFGASVEEHMPGRFEAMLKALHALVRRMLGYPVPVLVAVQGQCLGGGLEVAMAGHMIFAAPDASLGQPEMMLGVFAPAASCLMPDRMGQARAEDLLYSGRSVKGEVALATGLVDALAGDPSAAALAWIETHLKPKSASSLRLAVRAARADFVRRMTARLDEVEALYLNELMATGDAVEGLNAFLEKRPAQWGNR